MGNTNKYGLSAPEASHFEKHGKSSSIKKGFEGISMNIVITGHTSGLGKALDEHFTGLGHKVTGLSRSNGYDLSESIEGIDAAIADADVFVNNAFVGINNIHILYRVHTLWKDQDKVIVNISSDSADGIKREPYPYAIMKKSVDETCRQLQNSPGKVRVVNIRPGYMDTPMVAQVKNVPKLATQDVVGAIDWILAQKDSVYIRELSLRAR